MVTTRFDNLVRSLTAGSFRRLGNAPRGGDGSGTSRCAGVWAPSSPRPRQSPSGAEVIMDNGSFATLARLTAAGATRRGALRSVFAAALAGFGVAALPDAEEAGAKKNNKNRNEGCREWILSGAPDAFSPIPQIRVDDDLTIFLNGQILFEDDDPGSSRFGPLIFRARRGDRLRFVAVDTDPACHALSPLYLRCACGGPSRKLSDGVPEACPGVAVGEFFAETFTI